jgi:hypothetical protein
MKRNQKSGDKYIFYSEFDNNKSANALKVVACHSGMSANEYTIITIRGFKYDLSGRKPKVTSYHPFNIPDESVTLFTQDEYTKLSDICARAYLFLYTFDWGSDYRNIFSNKDNIDNITKIISLVPYYLVLLIGAVSYFNTGNRKSRLYEYINPRHVNETVYNPYNGRQGSTTIPWDEIYYIDVISGLVENFPPFLLTDTSKMFTEWVDTYYKHWDEVFMAEETKKHDEGYNDVQSDLYYATLSIVYEQRTRSGKKIIKKYVRLFNDNHPIVKEMTKQFLKLEQQLGKKILVRDENIKLISDSQTNSPVDFKCNINPNFTNGDFCSFYFYNDSITTDIFKKVFENSEKTTQDGLPLMVVHEQVAKGDWTIEKLIGSMREEIAKGYKLFVIDHLDVLGSKNELEDTRIAMEQLWNLVQENELCIVTFSQIVKGCKALCPSYDDLRGHKAKVYKSTIIITLGRHEYGYYNPPVAFPHAKPTYMRITKSRGTGTACAICYFNGTSYLETYNDVLCDTPGNFIDGMTREKLQKYKVLHLNNNWSAFLAFLA